MKGGCRKEGVGWKIMDESFWMKSYWMYKVRRLSSFQLSLSPSLSLALFEPCDWSMRISLVIFLALIDQNKGQFCLDQEKAETKLPLF